MQACTAMCLDLMCSLLDDVDDAHDAALPHGGTQPRPRPRLPLSEALSVQSSLLQLMAAWRLLPARAFLSSLHALRLLARHSVGGQQAGHAPYAGATTGSSGKHLFMHLVPLFASLAAAGCSPAAAHARASVSTPSLPAQPRATQHALALLLEDSVEDIVSSLGSTARGAVLEASLELLRHLSTDARWVT